MLSKTMAISASYTVQVVDTALNTVVDAVGNALWGCNLYSPGGSIR